MFWVVSCQSPQVHVDRPQLFFQVCSFFFRLFKCLVLSSTLSDHVAHLPPLSFPVVWIIYLMFKCLSPSLLSCILAPTPTSLWHILMLGLLFWNKNADLSADHQEKDVPCVCRCSGFCSNCSFRISEPQTYQTLSLYYCIKINPFFFGGNILI